MTTTELKTLLSQVLEKQGKTVEDFLVPNAVALGGHFMSSVLHIEAKVRKTSNTNLIKNGRTHPERIEELPLIAKVPAAADGFPSPFSVNHMFKKEIFFYKEILSEYQELLKDASLECDLAARYYGSKDFPTENEEASDGLEACILLENLKASGYSMGNRLKGLKLKELKLVIAKLAVFHALGVALKKLKPAVFEEFSEFCGNIVENKVELMDPMIEEIMEKFREDSVLRKYVPSILKTMVQFSESYKNISVEPWVTIIHMDFGIHNMMLHKREDKVDEVKFIDFQTYGLGSPTRDLLHLFFTSVDFDLVSLEDLDQLVGFYHEHFIDALKVLLKCKESDLMEFSRDQMDKQMAADASFELCPVILTNKVLLLNPEEVEGDKDSRLTFLTKEMNTTCTDKLRQVILYYDKKQWF